MATPSSTDLAQGEWKPDIDQDRLTVDLASHQRTGDEPHDWIAPYVAGFEASDGGISDCEAIAALHNAFPTMAAALREAWAHNEKLIETLRETDVRAGEWLGILEKMERERDEARAELVALRKSQEAVKP